MNKKQLKRDLRLAEGDYDDLERKHQETLEETQKLFERIRELEKKLEILIQAFRILNNPDR